MYQPEKINSIEYYSNYKGQLVEHLDLVLNHFKNKNQQQKFIYLAGDSSLDNKYWILKERKTAINGYNNILEPPLMVPDICYHLNNEIQNGEYVTINCAIEESTLSDRSQQNLLDQDKFIRDNIGSEDILVLSLGGNDVALKPSSTTVSNMALLMQNPSQTYTKDTPGIKHFIALFHSEIQKYINNVTSKTKPKKVVVCMIYNPDQKVTNSWANNSLRLLGYDVNPSILQGLIKSIFELATKEIRIEGTEVIAFPMFEFLDGKETHLYVQRVEPSDKGGQRLAKGLIKYLSI